MNRELKKSKVFFQETSEKKEAIDKNKRASDLISEKGKLMESYKKTYMGGGFMQLLNDFYLVQNPRRKLHCSNNYSIFTGKYNS